MKNNVKKTIAEHRLFENASRVTVALSGGADSVSLLHVLLELKEEVDIELCAAHLNHQLRGYEADRDENFVRELCEKLGVPLFCERADIKAESKKTGESIELAARRVRYEFLERVSAGGVIATAHTASDSAETMLYNLTRGTALKGLCGIPVKRGIFVRPLINVTREEVEAYCRENELSFVTDSTNNEDVYTRNKIRHNVVTVLRGINPAFERAASRTAKMLCADNDYLLSAATKLYNESLTENGLIIDKLTSAHEALRSRAVMLYLEQNGVEAYSSHIEQILGILPSGKTEVSGKNIIMAKNGFLYIERNSVVPEFSVEFSVISRNEFEKNTKINNLLLNNALDYDKLLGSPTVRGRIAGDSIRLRGRGVTKTLKKLFTENAVPIELRDSLPIVADEDGVIWIYNMGVAERVAITDKTEKFLLIKTTVLGGY
ncbi:MAG: tRNA lysidine(34) synthetase TilS [Clostridia bacterium]|nr:tRNA lysidine(34) synthetase TilS [Clostridia bacterium]